MRKWEILIFLQGPCTLSYAWADKAVFLTHNGDMCCLLTGCINIQGNHQPLFLNFQPPSRFRYHQTFLSHLCVSYLFILLSGSIPLPRAQVSTVLLSCRLMNGALLWLYLSFSVIILFLPFLLSLSLKYSNSLPTILMSTPLNQHHYRK